MPKALWLVCVLALAARAFGASPDAATMCAIVSANPGWKSCTLCTDPCLNSTLCPAAVCDDDGYITHLVLFNVTTLPLAIGSISRLESLCARAVSFFQRLLCFVFAFSQTFLTISNAQDCAAHQDLDRAKVPSSEPHPSH